MNADSFDREINSVLARAALKQGYSAEAVTVRTPLDDLIRGEEVDGESDDEVAELRRKILRHLLRFFFADGPHPGAVVRRVYAVAKPLTPELIMHMTCEDLANMLGETKAAHSWRILKIFSDYQRARGVKGFKAAFQKSESARAKYSRAQQGNSNRRGKKNSRKAA